MEGWNPFKKKNAKEVAALAGVAAVAGYAATADHKAMHEFDHAAPATAESTMPEGHTMPNATMNPSESPAPVSVDLHAPKQEIELNAPRYELDLNTPEMDDPAEGQQIPG